MNLNTVVMCFCLMVTITTGTPMLPEVIEPEPIAQEVYVPTLMYHHITNEFSNGATITPELFEEHMQTIVNNGYTPVLFDDMINFVYNPKARLPEKSVCITFDDGYLSNYEYAYPILKEKNIKANISIIGHAIGMDTYKDTSHPMIPHFDMIQALEMQKSGLIQIENHTYDMHQESFLEDGEYIRENAIKLQNETEENYILSMQDDFNTMKNIFNDYLGKDTLVFTYPHGKNTELSEKVLKDLGVVMTITTQNGNNLIQKGNSECLYKIKRYNICNEVSSEQLLKYLEQR